MYGRTDTEPLLSILANLEKASSTLRAFIDAETLEELLGKTVKRRAGWAIKPGKASASFANRYRGPIDLRVPAPKDGRPRSAAGATSFHFDHEAVKKTNVNSATGSATARNPASEFEGYASNPNKVAQVAVEIAERYLASAKGVALQDEMASRVAMMASNIGDSVEEREAFWVAAWAASNTPGLPIIELRSGAGSIAEWRALAADATTPKLVAAKAEQVVRERLGIRLSPDDEAVIRIPLFDPEAVAWADAIGRKFGKRREDRIVHYVKPRSGVVQLKLVVEIPHELHSEDRCAIIAAVATDLDALGVRYTIVAHAPDDNNDRRNEHLHILIFPGSCVRVADGSWDFRRGRRLRPGDIAAKLKFDTEAYPAGAFFDLAALDIAALRRRYAEHCNDRLERRGAIRRLDPRSYVEMGIAQEPQKHLGTKKAAMVAAGARVEDDRENMIKSLKPEFERLDITDRSERRRHVAFLDRVEAVGTIRATDDVDHLAALMAEYRTVSEAACELSSRLAQFELEKEVAWSAAERLRKKTLSLIKAISAGTASAADARNAPYIDARYRLALEHHQEIHAALKPWHSSIDSARLKLENDHVRLAELEAEINAVIERERFAKAHDEASRWLATTVLLPSRYPTPLAPHAHVAALIEQMQDQAKADGPVDPDRMIFAVRKPVIPPRIDAQGLGQADTALVSRDPFRRRFEAALEDVCKHQELAIGRVLKFIAGHGEEALAIHRLGAATEGRTRRGP